MTRPRGHVRYGAHTHQAFVIQAMAAEPGMTMAYLPCVSWVQVPDANVVTTAATCLVCVVTVRRT